jgi:hypothetical protein
MGIYVVVGASLLGALSCMLIAWSLWTRSQARKRARQRRLATDQHAMVPPVGYPTHAVAGPPAVEEEPRTQFMTSADLFGQVAVPDEPTQFLSDEDLYGSRATETDEREPATTFMSEAELFGDDDEPEVATAFMTTDEMFGRPARSDATIVLPEEAVVAEPPPPSPRPPVARPPAARPAAAPPPAARPPAARPSAPKAPPQPQYTGFVGDRANDADDDDDDDFGEDDPETELVHQAELLRLITHKRPE